MKKTPVIGMLIACIVSLPVFAATIHVPGDQPTIQAGIDAAAGGDTVLVANGRYTGDGNRDIDFQGKEIIVRAEGGPENCIVDCEGSAGDPHRGFIFISGEGNDSVLEGFTITNGYADDDDFELRSGGGIYCIDSSPRLEGNVITGNHAVISGGGIWCRNANPLIDGNVISGNTAGSQGGGIGCVLCSPSILGNTITENRSNKGGGLMVVGQDADPLIQGNAISGNEANSGGGILCSNNAEPRVLENTISGNRVLEDGGGIRCELDASPLIASNLFLENRAEQDGGAICCNQIRSVDISDNRISHNSCGWGGGGICIEYLESGPTPVVVSNNDISYNSDEYGGAGVYFHGADGFLLQNRIYANQGSGVTCRGVDDGELFITGNSIFGNDRSAVEISDTIVEVSLINNLIYRNGLTHYAAVRIDGSDYRLVVRSCTIVDNAVGGVNLYPGSSGNGFVSDCIVRGNTSYQISANSSLVVEYSDVEGGYAGEGNIDADPLFADGPLGEYYLGQIASGQPQDSPCVDTGDPASEMIEGTTRTDLIQDAGIVDMGYHYSFNLASSFLVTGPGPDASNLPLVRVFPPEQDAAHEHEFEAYGPDQYGVNVACGDVDGDWYDEIITGAGPGEVYGPHVRGFDIDGTPLPGLSFLAYGTNKYGVNVTAGDMDADGLDEIITGAGPGAVFGPHVRGWVYDGAAGVTPYPGVSYFAYGTPKWGVNVSAGDIDGDGYDEIITGAGPGAVYGPHVRGWDVDGGSAAAAIPAVSFLAYGTQKFGVNVTCGDVDGDGMDEIVTGAGPGAVFGPHVRGWNYDGTSVTPLQGFSFFAWNYEPLTFGVNVCAATDLNNDGRDELVAGRGPDPDADTEVKVFTYDGTEMSLWLSLEAFPGLTHGTNVAAGLF